VGRVPELIIPGVSLPEQDNTEARAEYFSLLDALAPVVPGTAIEEDRIVSNRFGLLPGMFGGFTTKRQDTRVGGIGAAPVVGKHVRVTSDAFFYDMEFSSTDDYKKALVTVGFSDNPVAVFHGCLFTKLISSSPTFVELQTSAKAIFVGCVFRGAPGAAGNVIANPNAITDVYLVGCYNKTGKPIGNVTPVGSFV
jgi:hypothetical protein